MLPKANIKAKKGVIRKYSRSSGNSGLAAAISQITIKPKPNFAFCGEMRFAAAAIPSRKSGINVGKSTPMDLNPPSQNESFLKNKNSNETSLNKLTKYCEIVGKVYGR